MLSDQDACDVVSSILRRAKAGALDFNNVLGEYKAPGTNLDAPSVSRPAPQHQGANGSTPGPAAARAEPPGPPATECGVSTEGTNMLARAAAEGLVKAALKRGEVDELCGDSTAVPVHRAKWD